MASRLVLVFEVLHDTNGSGPACDGTMVARFKSRRDADRFAAGNTCYGRPAKVLEASVPRALAQRWGVG